MLNVDLSLLSPATIEDLDLLAQMNEEFRKAERADDDMTIEEIKSRMRSIMEEDAFCVYLLAKEDDIYGYTVIDLSRKRDYLRHLLIREEYRKCDTESG